MDWKECKFLIVSDLKREICKRRVSFLRFFYNYCVKESVKVSVWLRLGTYLMSKRFFVYRILYYIVKVYYKHIEHKTSIQVPIGTHIAEGLKFFHHGCIIIASSLAWSMIRLCILIPQ